MFVPIFDFLFYLCVPDVSLVKRYIVIIIEYDNYACQQIIILIIAFINNSRTSFRIFFMLLVVYRSGPKLTKYWYYSKKNVFTPLSCTKVSEDKPLSPSDSY